MAAGRRDGIQETDGVAYERAFAERDAHCFLQDDIENLKRLRILMVRSMPSIPSC